MPDRPPLSFREALAHRWLLVLAIVGMFLLAAGALSQRPRSYEATAEIYLDTARTAPGFDLGIATGELLQHDFIVLATSRTVLQAACVSAGVVCTARELAEPETYLAKRVSAGVYKGTSTLTVTGKAPTPREAAALANAVALAMIDQDRAEVARLFKPMRSELAKQLADLESAMDQELQQLQRSPTGSPAANAHEAHLTRLQAQHAATFTRLQDVTQQQDRASNVATVVQSALPPTRAAAPRPLRYLLVALVAGLCTGLLVALLAERFDNRIFTAEGLAAAVGSPVALLASDRPRQRSSAPSPYSLALANVLARAPDSRTVLVAAASARDHSEAVAQGLGAVAARAGQRVVVVQADGHSPDPQAAPVRDVDGLTTITPTSENGTGLTTAVANARRQQDIASPGTVVLIAVPSPDSSPNAILLGRTAKRAVLTATAGVTRFTDARRTAELLRRAGVDVVAGVLLPRRSPKPRRP